LRKESFILSIKLFSILLEYYTAVVTAESESITQCSTNLTLLSFVEGKVQVVIELWIIITLFVVDSRRNDIVLHTKNTSHSLYCTSSTKEVKDEKKESDEFDLSDITAQPKELSREEIIAAAEAAAFGNDE
jgi:hypothetical protein